MAAMIEHIHASTGTKQGEEHAEGDDGMGEFKPPGHPVSERGDGPSTSTSAEPKLAPKPYAGGDVPVGPVAVEGFDTASPGPGPGNHSSPHPYVPYYTAAAGNGDPSQGAASLHSDEQERRDGLMKKLDYMIHLLEEQHDERTGHVTEELILYSFLGVFVIFVVDSFARAGKYVR